MSASLERLRKSRLTDFNPRGAPVNRAIEEFSGSQVAFACADRDAEAAYQKAVQVLLRSFMPSPAGRPMLIEGDDYRGCWLESTGSICAETLSRFCPGSAESTFLAFAESARADGLLPYKITAQGPAFRQIQMVTPLARSVWDHCRLNSRGSAFMGRMYRAMSANDSWLARFRDTRATGCVEAFCAYDTGMDRSPRFRGLPDTCYLEDPARFDPGFPVLPYLAPDLTANAHCQRLYLSRMASELGRPEEAAAWKAKADASLSSLMKNCFDPEDGFFYDRDALGNFVRIQTDVLLRVLACEIGDDYFFARSLERYLLNPRKFFAKAPLTSVAMDDPRFESDSDLNSWAGPTNFLSLLRAPRAFEDHGRRVELQSIMDPILEALPGFRKFCQCLDPATCREGFGSSYVPAALCVLDFTERSRGILPLPDGSLRFSSAGRGECAYSRKWGASLFEIDNGGERATVYRDGKEILSYPCGLCAETDAYGKPKLVAGISPRMIEGEIVIDGIPQRISLLGNGTLEFDGRGFEKKSPGGFILPT